MARYKDPLTGQIIEIETPELNPELIKGKIPIPDIITPADIKPVETKFQQHEITAPFDISSLIVPEIKLTEKQKEESEINKRLRELNERLIGEAAFRTEQTKALGIPEQETALEDLTQQLRELQTEAKIIPIQLQREAEGRGIT